MWADFTGAMRVMELALINGPSRYGPSIKAMVSRQSFRKQKTCRNYFQPRYSFNRWSSLSISVFRATQLAFKASHVDLGSNLIAFSILVPCDTCILEGADAEGPWRPPWLATVTKPSESKLIVQLIQIAPTSIQKTSPFKLLRFEK